MNVFDEFKKITGFDIESFFRRFTDFITNDSQNIIDYYSGFVEVLDRDSFGTYEDLVKESDFVVNLFDLNYERFKTVDFWELMEFADDIRIKLSTIGNFSKFARSSVKKASFTGDVTIQVATNDNETIEELMSRVGSIDRDNDWVDVAVRNNLEQEDYTLAGGVVLDINFKNNSRFFIEGVIDNPEGDKIKGLDIDKRIQFVDNDLKILSYEETLDQSLNILINLRKNDNPEFPQYGIDSSLIVGMNIKSLSLPSVVRQIYQTFSTDDIIDKLQITRTDFESDNVNINMNISIKSGEEQKRVLSI
jgi:hypothetical protein